MQQIPDIVLYHADCFDGFGAAWAIHRAAVAQNKTVKFVPVQYNKPLPNGTYECDLLYIVDFSFPMDTLQMLSASAKKIVIIDHHKSAQENLAEVQKFYLGQDVTELPYSVLAHFDMSHSGAMLTWKHFFPDQQEPALLRYIEDRDIWKWQLSGSEAINAFIGNSPMTFQAFDDLAYEVAHNRISVLDKGEELLRYRKKLVDEICQTVRVTSYTLRNMETVSCVAVRSPILQSEVGNELCERFPEVKFAIIYSDVADDVSSIKWSLRSIGDFDVSEIAKEYGGGGHRNAAGMTTSTWRMV